MYDVFVAPDTTDKQEGPSQSTGADATSNTDIETLDGDNNDAMNTFDQKTTNSDDSTSDFKTTDNPDESMNNTSETIPNSDGSTTNLSWTGNPDGSLASATKDVVNAAQVPTEETSWNYTNGNLATINQNIDNDVGKPVESTTWGYMNSTLLDTVDTTLSYTASDLSGESTVRTNADGSTATFQSTYDSSGDLTQTVEYDTPGASTQGRSRHYTQRGTKRSSSEMSFFPDGSYQTTSTSFACDSSNTICEQVDL